MLLGAVLVVAVACSGDDGGGEEGLTAEPFVVGLEVGDCFDRPTDPDVTLMEAVLFAVISGAAIQVVRTMLARRFARSERREARVHKAT